MNDVEGGVDGVKVFVQECETAYTVERAFECYERYKNGYDGAPVAPGRVYLAPGGESHLKIDGRGKFRCRLEATALVNGHRPSVDVLFESVAASAGKAAIGVILTGMGRDGAAGLLAMRSAGARTLGQDEASSVVYGMPRAAFEIGAVERQASLGRLSTHILALARQGEPGA